MAAPTHIAILGAGYVAVIRANQLRARVTVVEREKLGGWGSIPIKALLSVVEPGDGATVAQVTGMIYTYPTVAEGMVAEGMMEAMEDIEGPAIHQILKRAD